MLTPWTVLVAMAVMGFGVGFAGPSRDLLVRKAATQRFGRASYGRVYGFVYSGLDVGLAISPLIFGPLLDRGAFLGVLACVAVLQVAALLAALSVGRHAPSPADFSGSQRRVRTQHMRRFFIRHDIFAIRNRSCAKHQSPFQNFQNDSV